MNHKIFFFAILLFFQIIILDYFLNNSNFVFKDIWPLVAMLLSPFTTAMYIIANNVWIEDKKRDKISLSGIYLKSKENEVTSEKNVLAEDFTNPPKSKIKGDL